MNKRYTIIAENAEKGIAILADENGNFTAYVNGKHYSVSNGRPCNGCEGRQLRDDSRKVIAEMLPAARENYGKYTAAIAAEVTAAAEKMSATPAAPKKSFAEVLEEQFIATLAEKSAADMVKDIFPVVEKMVVEKFGVLPKVHEIRLPDKAPVEVKGVLHKDFDLILGILNLGFGFGVYMCGPAGTGKSYLAQQVAEVMKLEYYYTNSVIDDIQLKGFIDANGRYHETQFYKAFTNGGVFLLDELDASDPAALNLLNNALANGYFDFPTGRTTAHENFRCMAAGNTFGTGADNTYTGRYRLDGASMDRFSLIKVDYDKDIELAMADGDKSIVEFARDFRAAVEKVGTECLCTYRAIKRLAKFQTFMSKEDALRIGLIKGLSSDDVRTIHANMKKENEWKTALSKLF